MVEEFERTGDDPATHTLINSLMTEETEQTGNDSATLELVQALKQEYSK